MVYSRWRQSTAPGGGGNGGVLKAAVEENSQLSNLAVIGKGDIESSGGDAGEEAHTHQCIQSFLAAPP